MTSPWHNRVHTWLGRCLASAALLNVGLGMRIIRTRFALYIAFSIWVAFLAGLFLYLAWMKSENRNSSKSYKVVDKEEDTQI